MNFDLLLRLYEHLISFIHPLPDWILISCFVFTNTWFHLLNPLPHWILIFYFVITNTWFHLFICYQIEFLSPSLLLQIFDFIHLSALRLNYDILLRYYKYLSPFIHSLFDWILIFCSIFTNIWSYLFTRFNIEFWSSVPLLWILVFIYWPAPRLKFDLLLRLYKHLILFFHTLPDWILIFCFVFTSTWFHSLIRS